AHNMIQAPVAAGSYFGQARDLLILNGDIPNHSGKIEYFDTVYAIVSELTHGQIPTVFSRGNHDLRGIHAEDFADYTPSDRGKTYYTFRAGSIWGMVLDCGEDKPDSNEEYGYTICCHHFRHQETAFIRRVIANAEAEYAAPDVEHRLVVCHVPFTDIAEHPFDIEQELYGEWTRLLREHIKPDLMLYGHSHVTEICPVGGPRDKQGQPCPAIIGSKPTFPKNGATEAFVGCGVVLDGERMRVIFNRNDGTVLTDETLIKGNGN
ncbi:MAG: metallophosphoesterase, partial [Clostridia bacterium]|nr:metallophosphoesterase [Clostridia bacterium]